MSKDPKEKKVLYQIQSKSIDNRAVFNDSAERKRILDLIHYHASSYSGKPCFSEKHRFKNKKKGDVLVRILESKISPSELSLILHEEQEGGVTKFMSKLLNSYSRYYNLKHHRKGTLWQGNFKKQTLRLRNPEENE